jgi:prepilin-type N-terminal cleavage/methylation domain-containing protein
MAFMTITTPWRGPDRRRAARGFTLVEVLIAGSIGSVVLLGVLSTFLFLGRSQANVSNYADMERQARNGLEYFAQDVRQARDIEWDSKFSMTLTVHGAKVTYTFHPAKGIFTRTKGGVETVLIEGISDFSYSAYMVTGTEVDLSDLSTAAKLTAANNVTKQVQIHLRATRTSRTVATASNTVLSARFILRNKKVTV